MGRRGREVGVDSTMQWGVYKRSSANGRGYQDDWGEGGI